MMMGNEGGVFFGGVFMWLFWLIVIVVVIVVFKAMIGSGESASDRQVTPLEILNRRFARGEIDEEEYQRRKRELEK